MARSVRIAGFGAYVGKHSERLVVRTRPSADSARAKPIAGPRVERTEEQIPLFRVGEIVVASRGVTLSSDIILEACRRGIPITFLTPTGQPFAMLSSPMLTATTLTRRAQLRALDTEVGARICVAIVAGKLRNQASLLVHFAKAETSAPDRRARVLEAVRAVRAERKSALGVEGRSPERVREWLLGHEGMGGRAYWSGIRALLEGRVDFEGRHGRGAVDPVNALLNYGYGILASRAWAALLNAGLDPFAGLLHADRSGRPSLVLDLMEEFRAPVVDRAVLAYVRLGRPARFDGVFLDGGTKEAIADAVHERLEGTVVVSGARLQLASVIQRQARALATALRGESAYRSVSATW